MAKQPNNSPKPRFIWPWVVLAAFLLGVALAALWVNAEVKRTKQRRDLTFQPADSDPAKTRPPASDANRAWTNDMVWIPGGTFGMGADDGQSDEKPVHQVT